MYSAKSSFFNPHSFKLKHSFQDYSFIGSKIKQQINKLFHKNDYERLLSANKEDFFKMLEEKSYSVDPSESADNNVIRIKKSFKKEINQLLKGIGQLSSSTIEKNPLEELIFSIYDFNNFKVLYKGLMNNLSFEDLNIHSEGFLTAQDFNNLYQEKEIAFVPLYIKEALGAYKKRGVIISPQEIDLAWDFLLHERHKKCIDKIGSQFVQSLYKLRVDILNILTMFRLKVVDKDFNSFKSYFVPYGTIPLFDFKNLYIQSIEELKEAFKALPYHDHIHNGIDRYLKYKSLSRLERLLEGYLLSCVIRSYKLLEGPDLVLAYAMLKRAEVNNLGIAFVSHTNNIDIDWALKKMRIGYV